MTAKLRVYEVARDLGLENRELINRMVALGIQVRNHMSALEPAEIDRVKRSLEKDKTQTVVEERIRPTVVRRRTKKREDGDVEPEVVEAKVAAPEPEPPLESAPVPQQERAPAPVRRAPPAPMAQQRAEEAARVAAQLLAPPPEAAAEPAPRSAPVAEPEPEPADDRVVVQRGSLPLGVIGRGNVMSQGASQLSEADRARIVSEHAALRSNAPRRRELGRAALGPVGRPGGRQQQIKRKAMPGKKGAATQITVPSAQKRLIRIEDQIQLQALAQRMSLKATDVLMKLMQLGMASVHINSTLDVDTAKILASEFGYEVENVARSTDELVETARGTFADVEEERVGRPPIVTIMGHVDHGKTSLLDKIRSASVAAGEKGGITQHIGAYRVEHKKGTIVFLDTPGHEAFTSMRARGAKVTDIVILVCAADDGVMPQTKEAINHAKAAGVPIIVAMNKIDKPGARPDMVKQQLAAEGVQSEDWGGETIFVPCSAVTGEGIDQLLDSVLLQAEVLELRSNPKIPAEGTVLETYLDKGRGPVANVLISNGTLNTGDYVVAGGAWGRVRALTDDRGRQLKTAGPATPLELLGLSDMPAVGDRVYVVTDPKKAQEVAEAGKKPTMGMPAVVQAKGLDRLHEMMRRGEVEELRLVIKADVQGSIEALTKALTDLTTDKVEVKVIHTGVGGITENDVMLASASQGIIIGFGVRPAGQAAAVAKKEGVDIRMYGIIYEAVDEVRKAMTGLLAPTEVEKELGKAEVRQVFNIPKVGTVAGCYVTEGKIVRGAKVRLVRDSVKIWEGKLSTLRRFKDDAKEVAQGYECGLSLDGYNDVHEKDIVEVFEIEEVAGVL
jgi:translation initiation factor IF-2